MSKAEKVKSFDPNTIGDVTSGVFGLPFTVDEAAVVLLPVPWDATVSYGTGTADGPQAIFDASFQVDLFDPVVRDAWKIGVAMDEIPQRLALRNESARDIAREHIKALEEGASPDLPERVEARRAVDAACREMNDWVYGSSKRHMGSGKLVALIGGEHSTPLGLLRAIDERGESFGVLQIDAHCDLRKAYEGFTFSHASIMYNALELPRVEKLVQVGIRDYCDEEAARIRESNGRVLAFFDRELKRARYEGTTWARQAAAIVEELPKNVYLSFDIDGLDPKLCPGTGTPVPGGLEFEEALYLIEKVVESGRRLIALDINEVSPREADEWDASVGARLAYRAINLMALSNGLAERW